LLQGVKGQPKDYTARLPAILVRIDAQRRSGHDAVALRPSAALWRSNAPQSTAVDPGPYWNGPLICEILHREAQAVILYDPVFPVDPFAP
jgi:hypothetical protein